MKSSKAQIKYSWLFGYQYTENISSSLANNGYFQIYSFFKVKLDI